MVDDHTQGPVPSPEDTDRRGFLKNVSRAAMTAGLVGGYGAFAAVAGRFLYPAAPDDVMWQFVSEIDGIKVGDAILYTGPSGETINITRRDRRGTADDFTALSSTCPHLGCQVRWEQQNDRFFCPCHNGVFDPSGRATGGPPGEAGQSLGRYQLKIDNGILHIAVPPPQFAARPQGGKHEPDNCISGSGHDPCLARRPATESERA